MLSMKHAGSNRLGFFFVVFLTVLLQLVLRGEGGGEDRPQAFQVEQDWRSVLSSDAACTSCVRISRVTLQGVSVKGTKASARIEMEGDWIGLKDCRSSSGACRGFSPSGGICQKVHKTLLYKKLNTGWHLESYK